MLDEGEKALWAHALLGRMPGCCAAPIRRACVSVCALVFATASLHLSACLMTRLSPEDATQERLSSGLVDRTLLLSLCSAKGRSHDCANIH